MSRVEDYRVELREQGDWDAFLARESRLPGPRGNIELALAAAEEGDAATFRRLIARDGPTNTPDEFLVFCGAVGLGRLAAEGDPGALGELRALAADARWRVREGVAMGLQRLGDDDPARLAAEMREWAGGTRYEQRAAVAALCEPRLLADPAVAAAALDVLDAVTTTIAGAPDRREEPFKTLRKALGYGWSVAACGSPDDGLARIERWLSSADPDVAWVMRENLKKARLERLDADWVARARAG